MYLPGNTLCLLFIFLLIQAGLFSSWRQLSLLVTCADNDRNGRSFDPPIQSVLTAKHENLLNGVVVRAFPPWPENLPLPCGKADPLKWSTPAVSRSPTKEGILFVKEMKTGSSTVSGIVLRIARNIARRKNQSVMCDSRFDHWPARYMKFVDRDRENSFLFTIIRNPQTRIGSQFFHFLVSRLKMEPSDENYKKFITKAHYLHDYYLKDLALVPSDDKNQSLFVHTYKPQEMDGHQLRQLRLKLANGIMRGYNFIGITERMDECLVVLMMMLRLKISDIVYIKAKSSGNFDDGAFNNTCVYIVPSFTSPGMKKFFQSPLYLNISEGDWMLYRAAEKSLDMTIDRLGRRQFNRHLLQFQAAQELVNTKCAQSIRYPCSSSGVRAPYSKHSDPATDCLWLDSGCGYECIDGMEVEIESMVENIIY